MEEKVKRVIIQVIKLEKKIDQLDNDHGEKIKESFHEIDAIKFDVNSMAQELGIEERA